jgi:hypothetical protein
VPRFVRCACTQIAVTRLDCSLPSTFALCSSYPIQSYKFDDDQDGIVLTLCTDAPPAEPGEHCLRVGDEALINYGALANDVPLQR